MVSFRLRNVGYEPLINSPDINDTGPSFPTDTNSVDRYSDQFKNGLTNDTPSGNFDQNEEDIHEGDVFLPIDNT
ncbi:hypothetical protein IWQ62_006594, partial [Dispira parvispora]